MKNDLTSIPTILDIGSPYFEHKYISITAVAACGYLYDASGGARLGHVSYSEMSLLLGCDENVCREYLKLLRKDGLIARLYPDDRGGVVFKLTSPGKIADGLPN